MIVKVLLADDSNTALRAGETVFRQHTACEGMTAHDGQEAILPAIAEKLDLTLLDVVMPNMGGFAAYREIRKKKDFKNAPIVMELVSAFLPAESRASWASRNGGNHFEQSRSKSHRTAKNTMKDGSAEISSRPSNALPFCTRTNTVKTNCLLLFS
jgi:CheY-like chemotaxis protein